MQTQVAHERKSILQLSMLSLPGNRLLPENYDKAKTTKKYLQINLYSKNCNFLLRIEKRTTFMHVRNRVVDSACLNLCLLEFTARTLRGFVFKILRMYDFKQNLLSNNTFGT